jgi:alkaline phosphatase D
MSRRITAGCSLDRRALLKGGLGAGLTLFGPPAYVRAQVQFKTDPFSLGVASGDPTLDGFVIWTRLAPQPPLARGGIGPLRIEVSWEVADDPGMKQVVRAGTAIARVEVGHSVHVEVEGLEPGRDYFYRFRAGDSESPIGRSRTLPARGAEIAQLRFGVAGCQQWEGGFYTAYRIAEENFDFVFHYGDYIYEYRAFTADRNNRAAAGDASGFSDLLQSRRLPAPVRALQIRS